VRICQSIKAITGSEIQFEITIYLEEDQNFSVEMNVTAFPAGTLFKCAEDALIASVKALNGFHPDDRIKRLYSSPVEQFITNEQMATLLPE